MRCCSMLKNSKKKPKQKPKQKQKNKNKELKKHYKESEMQHREESTVLWIV